MDIVNLLSPEGVIPNLHATSKKQALQELAKHAASLTGLHERTIFDVLLERERHVSQAPAGPASSTWRANSE